MSVRAAAREPAVLLRHDSCDKEVEFEPKRLRDLDVKDLAVRFVFGFVVSVVVGIVGIVAGDRAAGLFLAFPAILPASLTLIAENDGEDEAELDALGAVLGGVGLAAYGLVSWFLLPRVAPVVAELAALLGWGLVAILGWMAVRSRMRA